MRKSDFILDDRKEIGRRKFTKQLGGAATTLSLPWLVSGPALASAPPASANDRIDLAIFGMGTRGMQLLENLPEIGRVIAVADPDRKKAEAAKRKTNSDWSVYDDPRVLLEKEKVDAVICCTSDHNHIATSIFACQAGADLYVEKPFFRTVPEGRALVELAKQGNRVLQVGTQSRSIPLNQLLLNGIRDGKYGKLRTVICRSHPISRPIPVLPEQTVPEWMNWDAFLGPARQHHYHEQLTKKWNIYRDFGQWANGGWGAHAYDMIQNAMGTDHTGPTEIWPVAKSQFHKDPGSLNTKLRMKYADGREVRLELDQGIGPDVGAIFVCDDAKIEINRNTYKSNPPDLVKELPDDPDASEERSRVPTRKGWMGRCHLRNWLECVQTRKQPNAHGELAQRAGTLCCLTTIARIINRPLHWDSRAERFIGNEEANALLDPPRRKGYELPSIG